MRQPPNLFPPEYDRLQDPLLSQVKLIAEPWDIGPGGYQLGNYPPPFLEWNDRFRDDTRSFWRRDPGQAKKLAAGLTGSALTFDRGARAATSSVNIVTAHDGFTLADLVSFNDKQNAANGEGNRDGHDNNHSDNMGVEGPTDDPSVTEARLRRQRATSHASATSGAMRARASVATATGCVANSASSLRCTRQWSCAR